MRVCACVIVHGIMSTSTSVSNICVRIHIYIHTKDSYACGAIATIHYSYLEVKMVTGPLVLVDAQNPCLEVLVATNASEPARVPKVRRHLHRLASCHGVAKHREAQDACAAGSFKPSNHAA